MEKYKKVSDMEVLKKYYDEQSQCYSCGIWCDNISVETMAQMLGTSKYQISKAYKKLAENGYMELKKVGTCFEEYDNGLYCQTVATLYAKAYVLTEKARTYFAMRKAGEYKISDLLVDE